MSLTKRIDGNFNIISINQTPLDDDPNRAEIYFDTNLVRIDGSLLVSGVATFVERKDVIISDNVITLNAGESGDGVTLTYAGLDVDRGNYNDTRLAWNETIDKWIIDYGDGTDWVVLTGLPSQGDPLFNVVEDLTPQLGGDLDVNGQRIVSESNGDIVLAADGTGEVRVNSPLTLNSNAPTGTVVAGEVKLYTAPTTGGGTEVMFENSSTSGELVSKTKAIVYALIF